MDEPKICGTYKEHFSVPCFEGEDDSGKTRDLPGQDPIPLGTKSIPTLIEQAKTADGDIAVMMEDATMTIV